MTYFVRINTWFLFIIIATKDSYLAASRQVNFKEAQDYFTEPNFEIDELPNKKENKMYDDNLFKAGDKHRLARDILENPEDQLERDMPDSPVRNDAAQLHFFSWWKGSPESRYKKNRNATITTKIFVQNVKPTASLGAIRVNANSSNISVSTTPIPAKIPVISIQPPVNSSRITSEKTTVAVSSTQSYLTTCYTITDSCANNMPLILASDCSKDNTPTTPSPSSGATSTSLRTTTMDTPNTILKKATNNPAGKTQAVPVNSIPLGAFDGLIIPLYQIPLVSPLPQESENETSITLIYEALENMASTESLEIFEKKVKHLSVTPQMMDVISSSLMSSEIERPLKAINSNSVGNYSYKLIQKANSGSDLAANYVTMIADLSIQNVNPSESNFSEISSIKNFISNVSKIKTLVKSIDSDKEKNIKLLNVRTERNNFKSQNKVQNISHSTLEQPKGEDLAETKVKSKEINVSGGNFLNNLPHLENSVLKYPEVSNPFINSENISNTQTDDRLNIINNLQVNNENLTHLRQFDLGNPVLKPSISFKEGDLTSPLQTQNFLFAGTTQILMESITNPIRTENVTVIGPFYTPNIISKSNISQENTNISEHSQPYVPYTLKSESSPEGNHFLLQNWVSTGSLPLKENFFSFDASTVKNNLSYLKIMKNNIEKASQVNQIDKNQYSHLNLSSLDKETNNPQNNLLQVEYTNSPLNIESNTKTEEFCHMNSDRNFNNLNYSMNVSSLQNVLQANSNNSLHTWHHPNISSPSNENINFTNQSLSKPEIVSDFSIKSENKTQDHTPHKNFLANQDAVSNKYNLDDSRVSSVPNNTSSTGTLLAFPLMVGEITQMLSNNSVPNKQSFLNTSSIKNNKIDTLDFPNITKNNSEINGFNTSLNEKYLVKENVFTDLSSGTVSEVISDMPMRRDIVQTHPLESENILSDPNILVNGSNVNPNIAFPNLNADNFLSNTDSVTAANIYSTDKSSMINIFNIDQTQFKNNLPSIPSNLIFDTKRLNSTTEMNSQLEINLKSLSSPENKLQNYLNQTENYFQYPSIFNDTIDSSNVYKALPDLIFNPQSKIENKTHSSEYVDFNSNSVVSREENKDPLKMNTLINDQPLIDAMFKSLTREENGTLVKPILVCNTEANNSCSLESNKGNINESYSQINEDQDKIYLNSSKISKNLAQTILMTHLTNSCPSFEESNITNVSQPLYDIPQPVNIFNSSSKNVSPIDRLALISHKSLLNNETENLSHSDSLVLQSENTFSLNNFILNPNVSFQEIIDCRSPKPLVSLLEGSGDSRVNSLHSNVSSIEMSMDYPVTVENRRSKTDPRQTNTHDGLALENVTNKISSFLHNNFLTHGVLVNTPLENEKKISHINADSGSSQSTSLQSNFSIENNINYQLNKPSAEILVNIPPDSLLDVSACSDNCSAQRISQSGNMYNSLKTKIIARLDKSNIMNTLNSNILKKNYLQFTNSVFMPNNLSVPEENTNPVPENLHKDSVSNDKSNNPVNSQFLRIPDLNEDKRMTAPISETENTMVNQSQRSKHISPLTSTENIYELSFRNVHKFTENITNSNISGFENVISADNISNNEQPCSENKNSSKKNIQGNLSSSNNYRAQTNISSFVEGPNFKLIEDIKPGNEIGSSEREQPYNFTYTIKDIRDKLNFLADVPHSTDIPLECVNSGNLTIQCKPKKAIEFGKTLQNEIFNNEMHFGNAFMNINVSKDKDVNNMESIAPSTEETNGNSEYVKSYDESEKGISGGKPFIGQEFSNSSKENFQEGNTIHTSQLENFKKEIEVSSSSKDYKSDMEQDEDQKNLDLWKSNQIIRLKKNQVTQLIASSSFKDKFNLPKVKNEHEQRLKMNLQLNNDSEKDEIDHRKLSIGQLTNHILPTYAIDEDINELNNSEDKITGYPMNVDKGKPNTNGYNESSCNLSCTNPVKIYFKYNDSFLAQQSLNGQNLLEICKNVTCQGDNILTPCCGSKQICPPLKCKGEDLSYLLPIPGLTTTTASSTKGTVENKENILNTYVRVARDSTLNDLVRFHLMHGISAPDEKDLMNALREVNFQVQKVNREFHPELALVNPVNINAGEGQMFGKNLENMPQLVNSVNLNTGEGQVFPKNLENMPQLVDTSKIFGNPYSPLIDTRINTQLVQNNEGKFRTIRNYGPNDQLEYLQESNILGKLRNQAEQEARHILELDIKRKQEEEKFLKQKEDNLKQLRAIQELQEKEYKKMSEVHKNISTYADNSSKNIKLKDGPYSKLVKQIQKCDTMKDVKDLLIDRYSELQGNISNYANNANYVPQPNLLDVPLPEKKLSDLGFHSNINGLSFPIIKVEYSENDHHDEMPKRVKRKCKRRKKENIIFLNEGSKDQGSVPDIRDFKVTFNSLYNDLSNLEKYITNIEQHSQIVAEANENPYIINNSSIMKLNKER